MEVFKNCKDLQYETLLNLLDNYLPLVLSIYTISFKQNNFSEYFNAMNRIWAMFTCFRRRHYNKAPLVWMSNIHHWGQNFPELYNTMSQNIIISDEYPVENTHSIIRAQTRHCDSAQQLNRKVKAIFQSKEKQSQFRSNFSTPKEYSFSQNQLKYLKFNCATLLTNVIKSIANNLINSSIVYKCQKKGTMTVHLPQIFGNIAMTETVLPLGFHGKTPPEQEVQCDLPTCQIGDENEEWAILHGCGHSFHSICIGDNNSCPLCTEFLNEKVKQLGKTIQDGIVDSTDISSLDTGSNQSASTGDDNFTEDPASVIPEDSTHLLHSIEHMQSEIRNLKLQSPQKPHHVELNNSQQSKPTKKPPHCLLCQHPMRGHGRPHNLKLAHCSLCPENICTIQNESCPCQWHTECASSSKNKNSTIPTLHIASTSKKTALTATEATSVTEKATLPTEESTLPTEKAALPTKNATITNQQARTSTMFTVLRSTHKRTTEWQLPQKLSQSCIFGQCYGSNACTIISVLVAAHLKNKTMVFPSADGELKDVVTKFVEVMKEGNQLYHVFDLEPYQPNLEVRDVLQRLTHVNLRIKEDIGFFSEEDVKTKFHELSQENNTVAVLIAPPDKSMVIYMSDGKFGVMDSHEHGPNGAIIATGATGPSGSVDDFVDYLSGMVRRFWNTSLCGANLATLE